MAFHDLDCIKNYTGRIPLDRLTGFREKLANRLSSKADKGFQGILAAFRSQNSNNIYKTTGLTIADYRARPVVSKSRCRPPSSASAGDLKNAGTRQFPGYRTPLPIQKIPMQDRSIYGQNLKKADFVEKSDNTAKQPVPLTDRQVIADNVQKAAAKYNLPPKLINAVIRAESNFKVRAVSAAGARGLMQLMPATAKELGVENSFDIEQNIDGGSKYLRKMLDRFGGNIKIALAAYNAGPGTLVKYNGRIPYAETRQYVKRVLQFSKQQRV